MFFIFLSLEHVTRTLHIFVKAALQVNLKQNNFVTAKAKDAWHRNGKWEKYLVSGSLLLFHWFRFCFGVSNRLSGTEVVDTLIVSEETPMAGLVVPPITSTLRSPLKTQKKIWNKLSGTKHARTFKSEVDFLYKKNATISIPNKQHFFCYHLFQMLKIPIPVVDGHNLQITTALLPRTITAR